MTAYAGRDLLLKLESDTTPGTFETVGGFRSNALSLNDETVDITSKASGGFREYLAGAGIRSLSCSGSGIFVSDAAQARVNAMMLAGQHGRFQVIAPGLGSYEADFAITSLDLAGDHNGEVTFALSLESAGPVSFTAA